MIRVDLSKCTGCRRCESACSFFHTGRVSNRLARIKVLNLYGIGVDGPVVCGQCVERYCLSCPEHALSIGPLGQIVASPTVCKACGVCEVSCPIGAIEMFGDLVYVCDLCGGEPRCVPACSEGALVYDAESLRPSLEEIKAPTRRLNPSERRHSFLSKQASALRAQWTRARA